MSQTAITGLLLGVGLGGSIVLLVAVLRGWQPTAHGSRGRASTSKWTGVWTGRAARRRAVYALAAGLGVLVVSRWPVAAGAVAALVWLWPTMFGARAAAAGQIDRLEALTTWTESLRDSMAGSVGLEQAIDHSIDTAPAILAPQLQRLAGLRQAKVPLPQALAAFAEEFDDASADLVVAALILNSQLRGRGLVDTLTALAQSARENLEMRRRVEEGRKSLRRNAAIIVAVTAGFAGGLMMFSREFLSPYSTPLGQVVLALEVAVFAVGFMWMKKAADIPAPERFLAGPDQIEPALASQRKPMPASAGFGGGVL